MIQSDRREAPNSMLPVSKHWQRVSVLVTDAEVRVATVLRGAQVGQGQGENFLHLDKKKKRKGSTI